MSTKITLNTSEGFDKITETQKVTTGYFSGGVGVLESGSIASGNISDTNEAYYYTIVNKRDATDSSAETQFTVAYGHNGGSGSLIQADTFGETEAIYKQWANTLLGENEVTGGFMFDGSTKSEGVYVLVGKRARFKDRINKKNWTIQLSGSSTGMGAASVGTQVLKLTDDSAHTTVTHTVAGPRFNIVSGSDGTVSGSGDALQASDYYGWFYPDAGVMIFSETRLSSSIPGNNQVGGATKVTIDSASKAGFSTFGDVYGSNNIDEGNALRFINCLRAASGAQAAVTVDGAQLKFRSEEDQTAVSYFCRVRAGEMNFSNNPTFVSGSSNEVRHKTLWGNPTVYITGVGLYNAGGDLVAVSKLSTPVKKNFSSETTVKVKLTY